MTDMCDVLVIGGGAAGFFAAIAAAERNPQARVVILEKQRQCLGKVRISGGGRCNVTHACFDPALLTQFYPRGGGALRGAFTRFQPRDTVAWFERRRVRLKTEADGRMFPVTDDALTIVNCLLNTAQQAGVQVQTSAHISAFEHTAAGFTVQLKEGQRWQSQRLLLATGSNAQGWGWAAQLGHALISPVPSLFTFNLTDTRLQGLAGVSVPEVVLTLQAGQETFKQRGPLLVTHWGLSGPAVLKLSAWGARALQAVQYQAQLQVNWWPALKAEALHAQLLATKQQAARRLVLNERAMALPQRLWEQLAVASGIRPTQRWAELAKAQLQALAAQLQQGQYTVRGKGQFKEEFVMCGGVDLDEVNFKTMESRVCPGLHLAGEILDIDGLTGGFNFQSAWTTGWLAGQAMG